MYPVCDLKISDIASKRLQIISLGDSLTVSSSTPFLSHNVSLRFSISVFVLGYNFISKMLIFLIQVNQQFGVCSVEELLKVSCQTEWWLIQSKGFKPDLFGAVVWKKGAFSAQSLILFRHTWKQQSLLCMGQNIQLKSVD